MNSENPKRLASDPAAHAETVGHRAADPVDQTLVAYLDGELADTEMQKVESQLASDVRLRIRLHELQATWDMLDELPKSEPERSFLESTMELVVTSARRKKVRWHRWPLRIAVALLVFAVTGGLAWQVVRSIQNAPYRELVENLDFYEHLKMYGDVDIQFLEELLERDVFAKIPEEDSPDELPVIPVSNRERFGQLTDSEVLVLKGRMEGFQKKSADRRREFRQLHQQILRHPDRDELLAALQAFEKWFDGLEQEERPQFRSSAAAGRVDWIQQHNLRMAQDSFGIAGPTRLPDGDVRVFLNWVEEFTMAKSELIIDRLEKRIEGGRQRWPRAMRENNIVRVAFSWLASIDEEAAIRLIGPSDIQSLSKRLSPEGEQILRLQNDIQNQKKLVLRWMDAAISSLRTRKMTAEELTAYYQNEMAAERRREVDRLLPEQRKRAIQFDAMRHFGGRGGGRGSSRGKRPGPPRGGPDRFGNPHRL